MLLHINIKPPHCHQPIATHAVQVAMLYIQCFRSVSEKVKAGCMRETKRCKLIHMTVRTTRSHHDVILQSLVVTPSTISLVVSASLWHGDGAACSEVA